MRIERTGSVGVAVLLGAAVVFCVGVAGAAPTGGASSSIQGKEGVLHGCYAPNTGQLRLIDTAKGQSCAPPQIAVEWNRTGPAGPQGPAGSAGKHGAPGAQGTAGSNGTNGTNGTNGANGSSF